MKRLIVFLNVFVLLAALPATAKTLTVTTLNGLGTGSLRHAIERAQDGDTIQFDVAGTITLIRNPLLIDKDLTIVGPGADTLAISGLGQRRVLEVAAGSQVLITGLTFTAGSAEIGGAILNQGALTLRDSRIEENTSNGDGGGVYNNRGQLVLHHVELKNNEAREENASGGAIYNFEGVVEITDQSVVSGNRARRDGGGLDNTRGDVTISDTTFSGNRAGRIGGAVVTVGDLVVSDTEFTNNVAENGAGIANLGLRPAILTNVRFGGNAARGLGGAVFNNGNAVLDLDNVTFTNNTASAGRGGALANIVGAVNIVNSAFSNNTARDEGGAIYNEDDLTISNSTLANNASTHGGALRNLGHAAIEDSTLKGNSVAGNGGAIGNAGSGVMNLSAVTVQDNRAEGNGGGIANLGAAHLAVSNSTIAGNAALNGGGLYNLMQLVLENSRVQDNTASNGGGGIFNGDDAIMRVSGSGVTGNVAEVDGGGIWNDGDLVIQNSELSDNKTLKGLFGGGGAVWNALTGKLTLNNTVCRANSARGADVFNNGGTLSNDTECTVAV